MSLSEQKLSRQWKDKGKIHSIRTKLGYAIITEGHLNILGVYGLQNNVLDGCCLSDPVELLKLRAQSSLFRRPEYKW